MELNEFEREVIDRLARTETELKQIRSDIIDLKNLEIRVQTLEAEENKRKGVHTIGSALWGLVGVIAGSLIAFLIGRLWS